MSTETLHALSGDLAFAVGYSIAQELIDLAQEAQIGTEELVVCVLSITLLLNSSDSVGRMLWTPMSRAVALVCTKSNRNRVAPSTDSGAEQSSNTAKPKRKENAVYAFAYDVLLLTRRLSQSIALQLLSSSVRADSSSRAVRILSLLSVTIFFVFLQTTSSFTRR